ncbi:DUF4124 domain-containing protein [Catenovulum sediminis]|uniref:DUF4124 domain-containing protein n=1 Tax=Catenovulum sediminis TaxID=1740262 RepID=UPI00117F3703|nr:DUF4124 domain-containing protein [Catenovulum sediminis]
MNKLVIILASSILCSAAHSAVYKCTEQNGKIIFSGTPCKENQNTELLNIKVPTSNSQVEHEEGNTEPDYVRESKEISHRLKIESVKRKIRKREREINFLMDEMDAKLSAIRKKKSYASNNLAGAEWETSLSAEMQAITSQYNVRVEMEREKIKQLNSQLATLESSTE